MLRSIRWMFHFFVAWFILTVLVQGLAIPQWLVLALLTTTTILLYIGAQDAS